MDFLQKLRRLGQQMNGQFGFSEQCCQVELAQKLYAKYGLRLVLTCSACPEQYDVFNGENQVAYLRLRHGGFTVQAPACGGELIYEAEPNGDGIFDASERLNYLAKALRHILPPAA